VPSSLALPTAPIRPRRAAQESRLRSTPVNEAATAEMTREHTQTRQPLVEPALDLQNGAANQGSIGRILVGWSHATVVAATLRRSLTVCARSDGSFAIAAPEKGMTYG